MDEDFKCVCLLATLITKWVTVQCEFQVKLRPERGKKIRLENWFILFIITMALQQYWDKNRIVTITFM